MRFFPEENRSHQEQEIKPAIRRSSFDLIETERLDS